MGQGNATLYCKYLVDQGISVFVKNKEGHTPRTYAQKLDRFKYHRVIKLLRTLEDREIGLKDVDKQQISETWLDQLVEDKVKSFGLAVLLGCALFIIRLVNDHQDL